MKLAISIPEPIQRIMNILHDAGGKPRLVGGVVRDAIIGIESSDIDIITIFDPVITRTVLTEHNILVKDTGIKYGTVTALLDNYHTQITTLRIDQECDGRHTNAKFTDDFEADAQRRDFTINAMSYCPFEERLYDYTGGYNDLIAKRVVFIRHPTQRIQEDYLRILRFFRFSDKFSTKLDEESLQACIELRAGLGHLSKERVLMEMKKIMESPTCHDILKIMIDNKLLTEVMPVNLSAMLLADININAPKILDVDSCTRFSALLYNNDPKILRGALDEMHFSIKDARTISDLVTFRALNPALHNTTLQHSKNIFINLWIDNIYNDSYMLISEYWKAEYFQMIHKMLQDKPPKFPVNGHDIEAIDIKGADIKVALSALKNAWIKSDFALGKEELLKLSNYLV